MKRKGLLSLFILILSLCSVFGLVNLETKREELAQASIVGDNVWDGVYSTSVTNSDYFQQEKEKKVHIYTAKGLAYFASQVNANTSTSYNGYIIKLETNIDLNNQTWRPIGDYPRNFQGTFDGQGHYIYNLNVTGDYYNVGFFGSVGPNGIVKNLHIRNSNLNTTGYNVTNVGMIVGQAYNSASLIPAQAEDCPAVIENCSASGSIVSAAQNVGGIVGVVGKTNAGKFDNVHSSLKNLKSAVSITTNIAAGNVGGIVGYYAGRGIIGAGFEGKIAAQQGGQIGGIVGIAGASLFQMEFKNLYNTGKLVAGVSTENNNMGGIIGRSATNVVINTLEHAYNAGNVIGIGYIAGLVGYIGANDNYTISNSYNAGEIKKSEPEVLSLVPPAVAYGKDSARVQLVYYQNASNEPTFAHVYCYGLKGNADGQGTSNYVLNDLLSWAKTKGLYTNAGNNSFDVWSQAWDFESTWAIQNGINGNYPYLKVFDQAQVLGRDNYYGMTLSNNQLQGEGTKVSPYLIYTAGDLSFVSEKVNAGETAYAEAYYALQNDIDLSNRTWIPIGKNVISSFVGVFDGCGHTIYGLNSSLQGDLYHLYGVFGDTGNNAVIKNLNVYEVKYLTSTQGSAGALIGNVSGQTYLVNCTTTWGNPVGNGLTSVHAYYGKANFDFKTNNNIDVEDTNTHGLEGLVVMGYDVEVDFNGGKIFDANKQIIPGVYHVLVNESGGLVNLRTYQQQLLPVRSSQYGKFVTGIKEGYKLSGFTRGESVINYNINWDNPETNLEQTIAGCSDGELKVVANFEQITTTITLHYNAYESDFFAVDESKKDQTLVKENVPYDSYLSDVWAEIFTQKRTGFEYAREDDEIVVYKEYDAGKFSKPVKFSEAGSIRTNESQDYYIKWQGQKSDAATHTFTLRVVYPKYFYPQLNVEDYAAKTKFALADAIKRISFGGETTTAVVGENYVDYIFTFNTFGSESKDSYLSLDFEIAEGYCVYNEHEKSGAEYYNNIHFAVGSTTTYGPNGVYGKLCVSQDNNTEISPNAANKKKPFEGINFLNLQDDYKIEIALEREKYSLTLSLDPQLDDINADYYLGFGPGVKNGDGDVEISSDNLSASYLKNAYIVYDAINQVLFADGMSLDKYTKSIGDGEINLEFTDEDGLSRKYRYSKKVDDLTGDFEIDLFEIQEAIGGVPVIVDTIAKMFKLTDEERGQYYSIEYFYGANFVIVAMTKNINAAFVNWTYGLNNKGEDKFESELFNIVDSGHTNNSKGALRFKNFDKYTGNSSIEIKTKLTTISTEFVYNIADLPSAKAPTFEIGTYDYQIRQQGEGVGLIVFKVLPSRYYKFAGKSLGVALGRDIKIEKDDAEINDYSSWGIKVNDNTHEITLEYTNLVSAGRYKITIMLDPIYYSLALGTNYDISEIETSASKVNNIEFDETIVLTTRVPNHAYYFDGWEATWYTHSTSPIPFGMYVEQVGNDDLEHTTSFTYETLYNLCLSKGYVDENNSSIIRLRANYTKKSVTLANYTERVWNYEDSAYIDANSSGISTNLIGGGTKTYQTMDNEGGALDGGFKNISFEKSGPNAAGFFIIGYKLFWGNEHQELIEDISVDRKYYNQYNLHDYLLSRMTAGETEFAGVKSLAYYIMPVLKRKEMTLIFHSGTEAGASVYSDGKNGVVYDEEGNETTDVIKEYHSMFGRSFDIEGAQDYGSQSGADNLNLIYNTRKGYHKSNTNYLAYGDGLTIFANYINFDNSMLANEASTSTQENAILHFYYLWEKNNYNITLETNGGRLTNNYSEFVPVTYESVVEGIANKNQISKTGYTFSGWMWHNTLVVSDDGDLLQCALFNENGEYIYTDSVTLVAAWTANQYQVRIMTNGANSYYKNGLKVDVLAENQAENYETYSITYDGNFATILSDYSAEKTIRSGFEFKGIYLSKDSMLDSYKIFATTIYNLQIGEIDLLADPTLTLYVGWTFVGEYQIEFDEDIKSVVYTATDYTISLGEYWVQGAEHNSGFVVSYTGGDFQISLPANVHVSVETSVDGNSATTFTERNAGRYSKYFTIDVIDGASYLNVGKVDSRSVRVNFEITKASIDVELSILEDARKLLNLKKIREPLVSAAQYAEVSSIGTLSAFAAYIKANDATASAASNNQIYEYVMTKSYFELTQNDYITYRNWSYNSFVSYRAENEEQVTEIVDMLRYFEFYDYQNISNIKVVNEYKDVVELKSVDSIVSDAKIRSELAVGDIKAVDESREIIPRREVALRVYLVGDETALNNYNLQSDDEGNKYFSLGGIFVLPQVLHVANSVKSLYSYYDESLYQLEINWGVDRDEIEYDEMTFYRILDNVYVSAQLTTTNIGSSEHDTEYSIFDPTNTLYFKDVRIVEYKNEEYSDISGYFKIMPAIDDVYTILDIKDVAEIRFSAKLLTSQDGIRKLLDVDESLATELLQITQVKYYTGSDASAQTDESMWTSKRDDSFIKVGPYTSANNGGILLFEIRQNNANEVSLFINKVVKKIYVSTSKNSLSQYIKLFKWTDQEVLNVDGTMEKNGGFEILTSDIEFSETGVTRLDYYAVYTDLVYVSYNLNFPDDYQERSLTSSVLQLGVSTIDDFYIPSEPGFEVDLTTMKAMTSSGVGIDIEDLFVGANNTFAGLFASETHAPIVVDVKWRVEEIQYEQILENLKAQVGTVNEITYENIVQLQNRNENLFSYSYLWKKGDQEVSETERLEFADGGLVVDNGAYKLIVTATIIDKYRDVVEAGSDVFSIEVDFGVSFVAHKLESVTLNGSGELEYNGMNRINDWGLTLSYYFYDNEVEEYSSETIETTLFYTTEGVLTTNVSVGGVTTNEIKNVGTYNIELSYSSDYFIVDSSTTIETIFDLVVTPCEVEIKDCLTTSFGKKFDADEDVITQQISTNVGNIEIELERQTGEDVGDYNLYVKDILIDHKENYTLTYDGLEVFKDSVADETIVVGTFTIEKAGALVLSYEATAAQPENLTMQYNAEGYSVEISNDFNLEVYSNGTRVKNINLILYDAENEKKISDSSVLALIKAQAYDVTTYLRDLENLSTAIASGTYYYVFNLGLEISKYFSSISFETGYQFTIGRQAIDVSGLALDKVYDGEINAYFDLELDKLDSIDDYDEVYIQAVYATPHVGHDIRVDLRIVGNGVEDVANFDLSSTIAYADITKLNAVATFAMSEETYVYGTITTANFADYVSAPVVSAGGNDVSSLLMTGYYSYSFTLPAGTSANNNQYIYSGNYTLLVTSSFEDFNMTIVAPTLSISALNVTHSLNAAMYRQVVTTAAIGPYNETITIAETGDEVALQYYAHGITDASEFVAGNFYDLELRQNIYNNSSLRINIPLDNDALEILSETDVVYLRFDSSAILTQQYTAEEYSLTTSIQDMKLYITNGVDTYSTDITFWKKNGAAETQVTILDFEQLEIYSNVNIDGETETLTSFTDAGSYRLWLTTSSNTYPNITFEDEYCFVIQKRNIDVSTLVVAKNYDGKSTQTISAFNEKIAGQDVSIVATYADANVGINKAVQLSLVGADCLNYSLSALITQGNISKQNAVVSLTKSSFVYGEIVNGQALQFKVEANDEIVPTNEYSISFTIQNPVYAAGIEYLCVGQYNLVMNGTSNNYNLTFDSSHRVSVEKYELDVVFAISGEVTAEFGTAASVTNTFDYMYLTPLYENISLVVTRQSGSNLGYYKALSASTTNGNYLIHLTDSSDGVFRVVKSSNVIYLLLANDVEITSNDAETIEYEFDGKEYDNIVVTSENNVYKLCLTNGTDTRSFDLHTYTYDGTKYTKISTTLQNLNVTLSLMNRVRDANNYSYIMQSATAANYNVSLLKYGQLYNHIIVSQKDVYFKESVLTSVFNNRNARFEYDDASEFVDGLVSRETLGISVSFKTGAAYAKYVGTNYVVEAELTGTASEILNYNLNLETAEHVAVTGEIQKAEMLVSVNSNSITYGADVDLSTIYVTETDVDLDDYDDTRFVISFAIVSPQMSSAGKLKAGEYEISCTYTSLDFALTFEVDGAEIEEYQNQAKVIVKPKQLSYTAVGGDMGVVFTKDYDNTTTCVVTSADLVLDGIVGIDEVEVVGGHYETENLGNAIPVELVLGGNDAENYMVAAWPYGRIVPIKYKLTFDYNANGSTSVKSNIEKIYGTTIEYLAFPFVSISNLTANSYYEETNKPENFPTNLTGYTGFSFQGWRLKFAHVVENSRLHTYLQSLATKFNIETSYENEQFKFVVWNNAATVELLNELIKDEANHDITGMYYALDTAHEITFIAEWGIQTWSISLEIEDENGRTADFGRAVVNGTTIIERTGNVSFNNNAAVSIVLQPEEHCVYFGTYDKQGVRYDERSIAYMAITSDGHGGAIIDISRLLADYDFYIRFKPKVLNVEIDLSNMDERYIENVELDNDNFVWDADIQRYVWTTNYFALEGLTLDDLGLLDDKVVISELTIDGTPYNYDVWDLISLQLLAGVSDVLTIVPTEYEGYGLFVTLDYNYDSITRVVGAQFGQQYKDLANWEEEPEREGYNFLGWKIGEVVVNGETTIATTENHTLTANWEIASFDVNLSITHGFMIVDGQRKTTHIDTLKYGETIRFTASADEGFSFASNWGEGFNVTISDGIANVSLTMPSHDVTYAISMVARENVVAYTGAFIDNVSVYDITTDESEIVVSGNSFVVESGKKIKIVVTPGLGYMMESFEADDTRLHVDNFIDGGVLTLEVTGIVKDTQFTFLTKESRHDVEVIFDDVEVIEELQVNGRICYDMDDLNFSVMVGEQLELKFKYVHGYKYKDCTMTDGYSKEDGQPDFDGEYYTMAISNVEEDGFVNIESDFEKYILTLQVISYNENKEVVVESNNMAFIDGSGSAQTELEPYGTEVNIVANTTNTDYTFAGWSHDGVSVFSTNRREAYTITDTETIYAIFSAIRFTINFGTYEYYKLYSEYEDPTKEETYYKDISGIGEGYYYDAEMTEEIGQLSIYYGASKNIYYKTPAGYRFYGYGINTATGFEFLAWDDGYSANSFNVSTLNFDENQREVTMYVVVRALSSKVTFKTEIDINGAREEDVDVGRIELVSETGKKVNQYGYVDGARTHYDVESFVNGEVVSTKQFGVLDYTGGKIYIKISSEKTGYALYKVVANNQELLTELISSGDGYDIYAVSGFIGGQNFDVDVLFKPHLNKIDISFASGGEIVDGGAFTFTTPDPSKVFSSGKGFDQIEISAYTDSSFRIYAYVDMGYTMSRDNIQIVDEKAIVVSDSITYQALDPLTSGYSCVISFEVKDFLGENSIKIVVTPKRYTIHLVEGKKVLVTIKNVEYNTLLNLSRDNAENILIYDERMVYSGGLLNVKLQKQNHNFEGFFSYENGAGVRYINSDGRASLLMKETGYYYDLGTSSYKIADNAQINEETGDIEISLFLYWSYLKTRITFTIVPTMSSIVTAQDMVSGVDFSNSWFYPTAPYYIEVAYNTSIKIVAPEIDGYKFYKFIISQKDKAGNWLTDVTTYSSAIPWETNEIDNIVEVNIQVIYFVKIDVVVYGGLGTYSITQPAEDAQAQKLVEEGYIDSTNPFTISALPDPGYTFSRWNNITSGRQSMQQEWEGIIVNTKSTFIMNLQGDYVKLRFTQLNAHGDEELYDYTHGQLLQATAVSINNSSRTFVIGTYVRNAYVNKLEEIEVKVGDIVTFSLAVDYGYGVEWNVEGFTYAGYKENRYLFNFVITAEMSENDFVRIIPTFRNEISSIYIRRQFADGETGHGAIDYDNVDMAGYVVKGGNKIEHITIERGNDIRLTIRVNDRYMISLAKIAVGEQEFDVTNCYADGVLLIAREYVEEKNLLGTLELLLQFKRKLWEYKQISNEWIGEGTIRNPYEINSLEDLVLMMQRVNSGARNEYGDFYYNANYILKVDIVLSEEFWTPIGTEQHAFNGSFDFDRHEVSSIYNLYIYQNTSYKGLFGVLGANAKISGGKAPVWYWYLIGFVGAGLIIMVISLTFVAKRRKERQEVMSRK